MVKTAFLLMYQMMQDLLGTSDVMATGLMAFFLLAAAGIGFFVFIRRLIKNTEATIGIMLVIAGFCFYSMIS